MLTRFLYFISAHNLFHRSNRILLTVSGGVDSAVMARLFHRAGFSFGIAHCNFGLRGRNADQDEEFVKRLSRKYGCPLFIKKFNTKEFAKENRLSIQMAARELRYRWFEKVRPENNYDYIATAHHRDDSIETVLLNFIRGTGIAGLHGILPKAGSIIRPMIFATRKEIEHYAAKNNIPFREDKSNKEDKYARNLLRNRIIPLIHRINPSLNQTMKMTIENIRSIEKVYRNHIREVWDDVSHRKEGIIYINIQKILSRDAGNTGAYLYEFLHPFGFNAETVSSVLRSLNKQSGKKYYSPTHYLVKDRKYLMIDKIHREDNSIANLRFSMYESPAVTLSKIRQGKIPVHDRIAYLDLDKLRFPLTLRRWRQGDYFYPLGMKKRKKLSDFFIDNKISLMEKDKIHLLCSGNFIAWIVGRRMDDRYKITEKTKRVLVAEIGD